MPDSDAVVVTFAGELDLATCQDFEEHLLRAFPIGAANLVIDLRDTTFMDSTGLACLLSARLRLGSQGRIILRGASSRIRRVIEVTSVEELFDFEDSPL